MSLHTLAHHLQSAGRGDDKVLVHMTPREVSGLQSLAMAHGGSLTINPHTGLPEAGFLSSILPMVAGFALNAFLPGVGTAIGEALGGLSGAAGTGILVGGGTALATGSLQKGLMAGLGAYGGAGLGEGLMSTGAEAMAANAPSGAVAQNLGGQQVFNAAGPTVELTSPIGTSAAETAAKTASERAIEAGGLGNYTGYQGFNDMPARSAMFSPEEAARQWNLNPQSSIPPHISGVPMGEATIIPTNPVVNGVPQISASQAVNAGNYNPYAYNTGNNIDAIMRAQPTPSAVDKLGAGFKGATGSWEGAKNLWKAMPVGSGAALGLGLTQAAMEAGKPSGGIASAAKPNSMIRPYKFEYNRTDADKEPAIGSSERVYFQPTFTAMTPYRAPGPEYAANGGLMGYAVGGPVETMSAENAVGTNLMYPQSQLQTSMYSNPMVQRPISNNVINEGLDAPVDAYTGELKFATGGYARPTPMNQKMAAVDSAADMMKTQQGLMQIIAAAKKGDQSALLALQKAGYDMNKLNEFASGGIADLGGYSDGGRLLKGPGDGVSDSIPAVIGNKQPARLADGEFVVPARIVSELGNGSTDAGAKKLYAMMDRVQSARKKSVGKNKVAVNSKSDKYLPA